MTDADARLQGALQHVFADPALLARALCHRSVDGSNYERLEYLGDGLLNFVIAEALFRRRPQAEEGELTRVRAALVREASLARIARDLPLAEALRLGPGELKSGGHRRDSILADVVEALVGAVYLDAGFEAARALTLRLFAGALEQLPDDAGLKDAKTRLQEWLQGRGRPLPEYRLLRAEGPPHRQTFTVACVLGDDGEQAEAEGPSRKLAEQGAAEKIMERKSLKPDET